jgi:hypothetical protein
MNNQEILKLKIAPVFVSVKIFKGDAGYNPTTKHYRSLADIKRIVELETYLKKVQAERINDIAIERKRWSKADLNAIKIQDLEQRANGIMDVRKANVRKKRTLGSMWDGGHIIHNMQLAEEELRNQAKALKDTTL